jgi:hypothetical protein
MEKEKFLQKDNRFSIDDVSVLIDAVSVFINDVRFPIVDVRFPINDVRFPIVDVSVYINALIFYVVYSRFPINRRGCWQGGFCAVVTVNYLPKNYYGNFRKIISRSAGEGDFAEKCMQFLPHGVCSGGCFALGGEFHHVSRDGDGEE